MITKSVPLVFNPVCKPILPYVFAESKFIQLKPITTSASSVYFTLCSNSFSNHPSVKLFLPGPHSTLRLRDVMVKIVSRTRTSQHEGYPCQLCRRNYYINTQLNTHHTPRTSRSAGCVLRLPTRLQQLPEAQQPPRSATRHQNTHTIKRHFTRRGHAVLPSRGRCRLPTRKLKQLPLSMPILLQEP